MNSQLHAHEQVLIKFKIESFLDNRTKTNWLCQMQMNCTTYVNLYFLEVVDSEQTSRFKPIIILPFFHLFKLVVPFVPKLKTTVLYLQICVFDYSIFVYIFIILKLSNPNFC